MSPAFVVVARIVSPFGIKGELKTMLETDFPDAFAERERYHVTRDRETGEVYDVEGIRFHKGAALVKLQGVDSLDDAEKLRGAYLAIRPEERADLQEGEYWEEDIVGLLAVLEDGTELGEITHIIRGKANDVWVTDKAMIPAVGDTIIRVDLEGRKVVVRAMEGLIED